MVTSHNAKYTPPQLPRVVSRTRLVERLNSEQGRHLVLVVGQAAQGKSTLVAESLTSTLSPVAWLHLDLQDGDCENFFQTLVTALARALPDETFHDFTEQAHISLGVSTATVRHEALLYALWRRLPQEVILVLDSLEQLLPEAPALDLCRVLVDLCAEHGRLIMISRQTPPFKLQRWVMHRRLLTLDNADLAFTSEEIVDYFQRIHSYKMASDMAVHVMKVTGGWVGGLVLLSQLFNGTTEEEWPAFLSDRLPASLSDAAWLYFAEEVFDALPEDTRKMFIHAGLLDDIDPEVVGLVLRNSHAGATLADMARRNLFTQAVNDASGRPMYRLNQLFRQFLQSRFKAHYDAASRRRIYRKIGEVYQGRRQAEKSVGFFLKAKAFDTAAVCLKKTGIDLVIRGRFADLENALVAFPEHLVNSDPWLFFFLTLTRRVKGGIRNIQDFETVVTAFEEQKDARGQIMALAYLIEAQVFSGSAPSACGALNRKGEALLKQQGDSPYYIYARTLLWLQIGFGYIASGLEIAKGISSCRNAYLLARKIDNPRLMANANIVAVMGLAARGDFELAEDALKKIAVDADTDAYVEYHALRHLVNAELSMRRGDLEAAHEQLEPLAKKIETFGLLFLYPAFVDATGMLQIYRGEFDAARTTCRHLLDVSRLSANDYYEGLSHRLKALRHYYRNLYHDAAAEAESALGILPKDTQPTLHRMRAVQLAGLIQIHLGQDATAEKRLKACLKYYRQTANTLSLCETHLALALLHMSRDDQAAGIRALEEGFAMAADRQFSHFVILSPRDLKKCCQKAADHLTSDPRAWSAHLLSRVKDTGTITNDATHILSKHAPSSPHLSISTFGGFQVLLNGQHPIDDKQWRGNRTKLLLKSILVHGIQDVPKDIIIEDLWPESSPSSSKQNFKVTLHRLRKCLEPGLNRHQRSAFVHLKDNLVSLDQRRCRIDVQTFLQCCKEIRRQRIDGETQSIGPLGERLMELYQGDFLPEDPYAPWVEMKRKALQDEYFSAMMTTGAVYEDQGRFEAAIRCCKAVIALDPCMEQAVEKVMILCRRLGRRGDAIQAYARLESALATDLDVAPSASLTQLYHDLRNKK